MYLIQPIKYLSVISVHAGRQSPLEVPRRCPGWPPPAHSAGGSAAPTYIRVTPTSRARGVQIENHSFAVA